MAAQSKDFPGIKLTHIPLLFIPVPPCLARPFLKKGGLRGGQPGECVQFNEGKKIVFQLKFQAKRPPELSGLLLTIENLLYFLGGLLSRFPPESLPCCLLGQFFGGGVGACFGGFAFGGFVLAIVCVFSNSNLLNQIG